MGNMRNIYKKNKKIIFSLFLILIFAIIGTMLFYYFNKNSPKGIYQIEDESSSQAVDYKTTEIPENLGEVETFIHKNPLFSFLYPKNFEISEFKEKEGETIVFQGKEKGEGFQIFISEPKEKTGISKQAIASEFPELNASEIQEAITGNNMKVFIFFSNDLVMGKMREVWFTRGEYFFQITSYASFDEKLSAIMSTWQF